MIAVSVKFLKLNVLTHAKTKVLNDAVQQASFCLQENDDGSLKLIQDHSYYYQIQMQMQLYHIEYGEFVVWRGGDIHYERILFDSDFMDA